MLGLAAYVDAGRRRGRPRAGAASAEGVAALGTGSRRARGRTARCCRGRCRARSGTPGRRRCRPRSPPRGDARRSDLLAPALADAGVVHPAPADRRRAGERLEPVADRRHPDRLRRRLAACRACSRSTAPRRRGLRRLAGVAAAWYFGNNPAKAPMYDPATGRTFDGVVRDGMINRNSGAESTIHGLLSMLALDAAPDVAAQARSRAAARATTWRVARGRGRRRSGRRVIVPPDGLDRRERLERRRVREPAGGRAGRVRPGRCGQPRRARRVAERGERRRPHRVDRGAAGSLGTLSHENAGAQGASEVTGFLEVSTPARRAAGRLVLGNGDPRHRVARRGPDPAAGGARRARPRERCPGRGAQLRHPGPARSRWTFQGPGLRACRPTTPAGGSTAARRSRAAGCAPACSPAASASPSAEQS